MSKTTLILVAASMLCGGTRARDGAVTAFEAEPGTELTAAVLAKLGLDDEAVADLIAKGAIAELDVRAAAASDDGADQADALAGANQRAADAEAKVAALEADLAAATKPPGAKLAQ